MRANQRLEHRKPQHSNRTIVWLLKVEFRSPTSITPPLNRGWLLPAWQNFLSRLDLRRSRISATGHPVKQRFRVSFPVSQLFHRCRRGDLRFCVASGRSVRVPGACNWSSHTLCTWPPRAEMLSPDEFESSSEPNRNGPANWNSAQDYWRRVFVHRQLGW